MPSVFPATSSDSLTDLCEQLGLPVQQAQVTIETFNRACAETGEFHPTELDGLSTNELTPPKTNWARPISQPPYYGYELRPGVTFTLSLIHI